jgi:hypothetical protein
MHLSAKKPTNMNSVGKRRFRILMDHMLINFDMPPFDGFKSCVLEVSKKSTLDMFKPPWANIVLDVRIYFERCMQYIARIAQNHNNLLRDKAHIARETLLDVYKSFFHSAEFMTYQDQLDLQALGYPQIAQV